MIAAVLALLAAVPADAAPAPERLFLLPVRGSSWVHADDRRILEERVSIALARGRRVQPLSARDLPAAARAALPADLATCIDPACLVRLGKAARAAHVLALELLEDGNGSLLFATLFDGATGAALDRRELPRAPYPSGTRRWADEIARWIGRVGDPTAPPEEENRGRHVRYPDPVLAVIIAPGQETRAEARALLAALTRRLDRRGRPRLALDLTPAPGVTHHAVIAVEGVSTSHRPHLFHRHQRGQLVATLSLAEARGGPSLFSKRVAAQIREKVGRELDPRLLDRLAEQVAGQWMDALESHAIDRLLTTGGKP
jgi:hypothetical protein